VSMSKKSFWSSIPGLVTGIAGILTAGVGLVSVLIALGVIGGSDSNNTTASTGATDTTVSSPSGSSGAIGGTTRPGAAASSGGTVSFTVDKATLTLKPLTPKDVVKVTNQGSTPLAVKKPELFGTNKDKFDVDASECTTAKVPVGQSCDIVVTFTPGAEATATLQVTADGATSPEKVALKGALL
jgi:hypothetical protein